MKDDCVILVPVAAAVEPDTHSALRELSSGGYPVRFLYGASDIALARSVMATQAIEDGFDATLWIDADVKFTPDDVAQLCRHDEPFVAGLYPRKGQPDFAARFRHGGPVVLGTGGGLVEMDSVGMGFTFIRAEVYAAVARRERLGLVHGGYDGHMVVPYFLPAVVARQGEPCYLSEDAAFCHRAAQAGYPAWADTTIKLGHTGRYTWTWDDFVARDAYASLTLTITEPTEPALVP